MCKRGKRGVSMSNKWKKYGIITVAVIGILYLLFLIVPFFLTGMINSYVPEITKTVEDTTGFKLNLENIHLVTTPKLTAGVKIEHTDIMLPDSDPLLSADNLQVKISLLPLLFKRIELDMASCENVDAVLKVEKDGKFLFEKYLPTTETTEQEDTDEAASDASEASTEAALPFGFKLSNHLPNITVKNYNISFVDLPTSKTYSISGNEANLSDFILDKSIKIKADGKVTLDNVNQFNYDIKVFNKIMPAVSLNDLVFNQQPQTEKEKEQEPVLVNVIDIFKALYNNQLTADLHTDLKISGSVEEPDLKGTILVDKLGIAVDGQKLPDSTIGMEFKGSDIVMNTKLYSGKNEITQLTGDFKTGKHPKINMNFKSNAQINSLIAIIDSVAKSFNYNDLDTLRATGAIDADFALNSNLKTVESSGYFKIPDASITYPLYNAALDKIHANIDFSNNQINISESGFSIFNHPLKIYGTIKHDATADIHLTADKLQIKSLLLAAGQAALLKENNVNSGTLSADASLKGSLDKPEPKVNITLDNINVKNVPSNTGVSLAQSTIDITTDGKTAAGKVNASQIRIVNPLASVSVPDVNITIGEKDINIANSYLLIDNSRIDFGGKITDYLNKNLHFDITANGDLVANDIKNLLPKDFKPMVGANGKLPLNVKISGNDKNQDINFTLKADPSNYVSLVEVDQLKGQNMTAQSTIKISGDSLKLENTEILAGKSPLLILNGGINNLYTTQQLDINAYTNRQLGIVIPGFSDSKLLTQADINISGTALNPELRGAVDIPSIKIPSMLVEILDLRLNLSGPVATGKGTAKKLTSGGIIAENLAADFNLKDYNTLYLKNITGTAFEGKINGDVAYDIAKNSTSVNMTGSGMNAVKAIEGAAGIKNALSGTLGFTANVSLNLANETEMMKSLKGNVGFNIDNGTFLNIGKLENLLFAENITSNSIMRAAVNSITALPTIKNTAQFKYITGELTFNDGWANVKTIKTSGPSMCYYITGRYNLLNGTANLTILGRLSAEVVKLLGPIGELSVDKLTSFIPKFGNLTSAVIKTMTTNPKGEKISEIPQLSTGSTNYKDFKVAFNGGIESKSSVKSFKWLSECDTSQIESVTVKEQIENTKNAIQEAHQNTVNSIKNSIEEVKKQNEAAKQQFQDIQNNLKNLFKPQDEE